MRAKFLLLALIVFFGIQAAHASKLPDNLWQYIKQELPQATQRFDSVVVLSKDTMYIPLYPAQRADVENISIDYTYPQGKNLKQKPEIIIFNNNFVLMKLFKDKSGSYSITKYDDVPLKVKLGVMPQDMLVPPGLVVPENLKLILGDLVIPSKKDGLIAIDKDGKGFHGKEARPAELLPLNELKNKKTYISTAKSKFIYVFDGSTKTPIYELKLNGLPEKILASDTTKFALVVYFASKNLEIIDLKNERVLTQIPLEGAAKDGDIDQKSNIAYVTSAHAKTIYCVDLNSAKLTKAIKLEQSPSKIAVSKDGKSLVFSDIMTQEIYCMNLDGEYISRFIAKTPNISKLLFIEGKIYALSRNLNKLFVYDSETGELADEENLDEKPVDALYYNNKIYILCAKEGMLDIYDIESKKVVKNTSLDKAGFYSKITPVPNQPNALITGIGTNKFLLFNLEKMNVSKKQPSEIDVSNIVIIDKGNAQDL